MPLQHGTVSVTWLVVIWLLPTLITFEPTVPDIISWVGRIHDVRLPWNQRWVPLHIITPIVAAHTRMHLLLGDVDKGGVRGLFMT